MGVLRTICWELGRDPIPGVSAAASRHVKVRPSLASVHKLKTTSRLPLYILAAQLLGFEQHGLKTSLLRMPRFSLYCVFSRPRQDNEEETEGVSESDLAGIRSA